MNAQELKALQAPIKEKYKADPQAAVVTLRAEGRLGEGIACRVDTGRALVEAGLHPASGGSGLQACSGDMLLEQKKKLLELTERYCVVLQTIRNAPPVVTAAAAATR